MGVALTVCVAVFLACASVYAGTMWCVRMFLYPSWTGLSPDTVGVHFVGPVAAATKFFTILFPVATGTGIAVIALSWWSWTSAAMCVALAWLYLTLFVFRTFLAPVNRRIAVASSGELGPLLHTWMRWNNVRWMTTTAVWASALWCVLAAGDVAGAAR